MKILVPHDRSEMSDKALSHAINLVRLSDAEIIILNVLERLEMTDSSVLATLREGDDDKSSTDLEITMTGEVKQLIEEKTRLCREAGVKSQNILSNPNWKTFRKNSQSYRENQCRSNNHG